MKGYEKNTGFTKRPHVFQIFSYVLFLANITIYTIGILPFSKLILAIVFSVFYYLTIMSILYFGYICTSSDPTDEIIKLTREAEAKGEPFDTSRYDFYCATCKSSVRDNSKHCWQCNRCVDDFDHHCKWVNNCISKKNYKPFLFLISSVALSNMIFCIASLIIVIRYGTKSQSLINDSLWYQNIPNQRLNGLFFTICVLFIINLIFLVLDAKLLYFHVWLIRNKLSTYEYIKVMREKQIRNARIQGKKNKIHAIEEGKEQLPEDYNKGKLKELATSPLPQKDKLWNALRDQKTPDSRINSFEIKPLNIHNEDPNHTRDLSNQKAEANLENSRGQLELDHYEHDAKVQHGDFQRKETPIPTILGENSHPIQIRATGQFLSKDLEGFGSPAGPKEFLLQRKNSNPDFSGNYTPIEIIKGQNSHRARGIRLQPLDLHAVTDSKHSSKQRNQNMKISAANIQEHNESSNLPGSLTFLEDKREL